MLITRPSAVSQSNENDEPSILITVSSGNEEV